MMANRSTIKWMVSFLLLTSLACGLSDFTGTSSPQEQPGQLDTAVAKSLAETSSIQTAIAQGVAETIDPGQQVTSQNSTQSQPELPSLTPTIELSPTTEKPMVSVSQVTNCRSGPGSIYDWLGALNVGQQAEVFGRDPANTSWYIRNPNNSTGFCWIYGSFATITGNTNTIPVFTPMPTPTPAKTATSTKAPIDFIVTFLKFDLCAGPTYYARYTLYNNSAVTWQSFQAKTTDTATAETQTVTNNSFTQYITCNLGVDQDDLTPGESGEAWTNIMAANPSGHLINAVIKLCTLDNLGGTCITKSLNFTAP
jgi:uncharacterized protein YgiM (DUF1202 family)